jgi:hypothetical protein
VIGVEDEPDEPELDEPEVDEPDDGGTYGTQLIAGGSFWRALFKLSV